MISALARPFRRFLASSLARSLRFRLVLLVLLAMLPSLILLFITASQQRDDALAAGQDEARRLARLVAADQSTTSDQIGTVLGSLALTSELRGDDAGACRTMLQGISGGANASEPAPTTGGPDFRVDGATFAQVVVLNNDMSEFCAGPAGLGMIEEADRELAVSALETGRVTAGNHRTSTIGSLVLTYAVPLVREDQQERRVILASVNVYALSRFASDVNLPRDSFIVIFDNDGVLQQRYDTADKADSADKVAVGASLAGTPVVDVTLGRAEPEAAEGDGAIIGDESYVFGSDEFFTPGNTGNTQLAYAMVGFPESVVVERANQKFNENLGKLGIAAMVALVAAWVGADLFVGRDAEARKGQIRDFYHAFSTGSINELDQIIGPGYVDRSAGPKQAPGINGLRQNIAAFRTSFPDGRIIIRELLADNDKVVARVTLSGTHVADYLDIPATGKYVVADGVETFRFMHGMVVESWSMFGELRQRTKAVEEVVQARPERPGLLRRFARRRSRVAPSGAKR